MGIKRKGNTIHIEASFGWFLAFALLLVCLQAVGAFNWPWYWLVAPIWMPLAFVFGMIGVFLIFMLLVMAFGAIEWLFGRQ